MKNAFDYRLRLVAYARQYGIRAGARDFHTTVPTASKWLRRYDPQKLGGLQELSRPRHSCPPKITGELAQRGIELSAPHQTNRLQPSDAGRPCVAPLPATMDRGTHLRLARQLPLTGGSL